MFEHEHWASKEVGGGGHWLGSWHWWVVLSSETDVVEWAGNVAWRGRIRIRMLLPPNTT